VTDESKLRELVANWRKWAENVVSRDKCSDISNAQATGWNQCAEELESLLTPQPRFVPGMKIGPGHGRNKDYTLKSEASRRSDCVWWDVEETEMRLPFYPDDISRVIYDPRKPAQWKPGQRLIGPEGEVVRLVRIEQGNYWRFDEWKNGGWKFSDGPTGFWIEDGHSIYIPWPRVGDWVRCKSAEHNGSLQVFRVASLEQAESIQDTLGDWHPIEQLEPTSPPETVVERMQRQETEALNERSLTTEQRVGVTTEVTKEMAGQEESQRFTGPHWEEVGKWSNAGGKYSICIMDLARAIEAIESRLAKESL
jgi:hypothetical protein